MKTLLDLHFGQGQKIERAIPFLRPRPECRRGAELKFELGGLADWGVLGEWDETETGSKEWPESKILGEAGSGVINEHSMSQFWRGAWDGTRVILTELSELPPQTGQNSMS